jgi:hypothetical protein
MREGGRGSIIKEKRKCAFKLIIIEFVNVVIRAFICG